MAKEANTGGVESISARVTKPTSKKVANAEVDMNWLYAQLIMVLILYHIHEQFSLFDTNTNFLTGFMISLLQHPLQEYEKHKT